MFPKRLLILLFLGMGLLAPIIKAQQKPVLKTGAKVFISPMPDAFDTYLRAALEKKKVPLTIVSSRETADYEISGSSETQKASTAKKIIRLNWHSSEQASISIADLKTGEVIFAYSVNKESSAHGKQSTAEACAKHIKEIIQK